ncbi:MAG: hypothetical protein BWX80_03833 [Candidatus Hydrogenedentes bacterium ADurb.Bin101]|nr:MAG: hypothetical protein BWX80_03833 [Candidatus Hydrogenedentes bacterium ADurb.Bin101]
MFMRRLRKNTMVQVKNVSTALPGLDTGPGRLCYRLQRTVCEQLVVKVSLNNGGSSQHLANLPDGAGGG